MSTILFSQRRLLLMLTILLTLLALPAAGSPTLAQSGPGAASDAAANEDAASALVAEQVRVMQSLDSFGVETQMVEGLLTNTGDMAYTGVNVYLEIPDDDGDDLLGEGFGYLTDACGTALLEFPLQPGQSQRFVTSLELYESDAAVDTDDIVIIATGSAAEPADDDPAPLPEMITRISTDEVVAVQWQDENRLLYGTGCDERVFTTYRWYEYVLESGETTPLDEHPDEQHITDAMIRQTGINMVTQSREQNPQLFERSFLTYPAQSRRIVYQTDIHTLITAERDGSFKRVVHDELYRYSLQGFTWSPLGNFAAYYFGAYGEPVRYFTASADGQLISGRLESDVTPPSRTVPGISDDGRAVIISGTFPDANGEPVSGYWLKSTVSGGSELLFAVDEEELPGNNYPAPAYYRKDAGTRYIYVIRPIDGQVMLECYHREGDTLHTLTELPLRLDTDERAWSWLSPEAGTLAVSANGAHSGLWLVDLDAFDVCR